MRNASLGPKLILSRAQVEDMEDVPDEPEDFEKIIVRKIKYKQSRDDRYDTKGRRIAKGTGYEINFDTLITVCVFDPEEEVVQVKDTITQCTTGIEKINPRLNIKSDGSEIILFSILKRSKNK